MTDDTTTDTVLQIDPDRSVSLAAVGGTGLSACVAIDADGTAHLVLAEDALVGDPDARVDTWCPGVEHEQLGELPAVWRHRVALCPARCGRPRADGRPCRALVAEVGQACAWHRDRR